MVATRSNSYLDDNNLHELLQSAYKQGHSTETALVKVQNDISRSNDERKCVALLLLDLSAAFDTVDHSMMLSRLRHRFGIDGKALKCLHSYLSNRSQFEYVENGYSSGRDFHKDPCWDQFHTYYIPHPLQMLSESITCLVIFTQMARR